MKYTSGYDPIDGAWIVGEKTERGTVKRAMYWYGTAEEAEQKADLLNKEHSDE